MTSFSWKSVAQSNRQGSAWTVASIDCVFAQEAICICQSPLPSCQSRAMLSIVMRADTEYDAHITQSSSYHPRGIQGAHRDCALVRGGSVVRQLDRGLISIEHLGMLRQPRAACSILAN